MNVTEKIPVLMVDDRPENLTSLEALLDDMGLELVKADSGSEALRRILHTDFALVLLDVQMPEMDGFETADYVRRNPKTQHLPVIFITAGMKDEQNQFKGYATGAVDYLMKPIEPEILRSKVRVFCDLFAQRRKLASMQAELELQNGRLLESNRQLEEETARRLLAVEELRKKDQLMIHQGRMAAMGEMLDNIAHQWRQPLNILGLLIQEIALCHQMGECPRDMIDQNVGKSMEMVKHLSRTIDDFRDITAPDRKKKVFEVKAAIEKTLSLVEGSFRSFGIAIEVDAAADIRINGSASEFSQVLLNLLMNAKDACREKRPQDAQIRISCRSEGDRAVVTIADNAGGIEEEILEKVFDAYFTTKAPGKGTGVGLFMSKNIIEQNIGGTLTVRNMGAGAEFRIEV